MPQIGTRALELLIDGENYSDEVATAKISSSESDSDFVTFAVAATGGARTYTLEMTLVQDTDAVSLWSIIWDHNGETIDFEIWPNGLAVDPSPTKPKIYGQAIVSEPDGDLLGGDADKSATARMTTEIKWECLGKPTKDTGES